MGDGNPNPFRKTEHYYQSSEWTRYSQPQYTDPNYRPESYTNSEPMKYLPYDNYNTYVPSNSHGYGQSNSHSAPPNSHNYGLSNSHNYGLSNSHNYLPQNPQSIQSNVHSMQSNVPNYGQSTHPVDTVNLPYQSQVIDTTNMSYPTRQIPTEQVSVQYKHDSIPMRYNTYPMNSINPINTVNPNNPATNANPVNNMNQADPVNSANSMGLMNYYNQRNMSGYKNDSDVNYYQNYMYYSGRVPGRAGSDVTRPEIQFSRNYENLANKNFFNASLSFKEAATAMLSMDANKKNQSRQRTPNRGRGSARGLGKVQKTENSAQTTSILDQTAPRVEQNAYQKYSNTKTIYQPQTSKNIEPIPVVQFSHYKPPDMNNRADVINRLEANNRIGDMNRVDMNRMNMNRMSEMNRGDMVKQGEMGGKDSGYNNYFMINSKINSPEYAKYRNRGLQQLTQYNLMSQYSQQHGIGNYISNVNNYSNVNNFTTLNNHSNLNNYANVNRNFKKIGPNALQGPPRFIPPNHKPIPPLRNEPINKLHVIEEIHADNDYMNNIKTNSISSACSLMESFQHSLSNKRKRIRNCLVEDCRNIIGEQPKIDIQYSSTEVNGKKRYFLSEILSSLLPYHVFYCDQLEQPKATKFDYTEIKDQIQQVQQSVENISNNNDYEFNQSVYTCVKESLVVCNEFVFGPRKFESNTPQ